MKTQPQAWRNRCEGSALLMAIFVAIVILPVIAVYIISSQNQYQSVARSEQWNESLTVVESGIEEAFAHLNRNCYPNWENNGVLAPTADGWTMSSTALYNIYSAPRRYIGSSYYDVSFEVAKDVKMIKSATWPDPSSESWALVTVKCVGYSPILVSQSSGLSFATINSSRATVSYVARQVRVEAIQKPFFDKGQVSGGDSKGNGQYLLDAFDSMENANSFFGLYDPAYRLTNGGSIASINGNIDLGAQGKIYGTGDTSSSGYITNGSMGSAEWIESGNTGNEPGSARSDLNEPPLEQVELPDETWMPLLTCNCYQAYTNPAVDYQYVQSETLPTPLPSGPISTNTSGWVYGALSYPASVPPGQVQIHTNSSTSTVWVNPSNIVNFLNPPGIITNYYENGRWYTNWAQTVQEAPTYPVTYAVSPGVILGTSNVAEYFSAPPPAACMEGTYTIGCLNPNRKKESGVWHTNYCYTWKQYYAYKVPESYTWNYRTYDYPTTIYTYIGTNILATVETNYFKYVAGTGFYKTLGDFSLSGTHRMLVNGNAVIHVTGDFSMSGGSQIVILRGASLTLYFAGDVSMSGQGIANRNDNALNLTMYGLPTCTNISISGNAGFTGSLYAPDADITLRGGGNDHYDIVGALAGKTVTANGHFGVHYDVNLARKGPTKGYVGVGWEEEKVGTR